ncbi:hypothetical protein [Flammeovirga sp. SJP92]|uniref:hypothetical protein n=1 Tax=Flammeovirga sp. SJP92 TaxID=1775430 RepID=UPI000788ECCC|nr:hypothetical protein [Flammeovirga sp. SJP92]KXX67443.1 hypothetical protein AVL50_29615 [Flammeovirga sp. SJP92]KXX72719.1 hypothetical protein AVL50_32265 [Flammeovirga sp. SJP92]
MLKKIYFTAIISAMLFSCASNSENESAIQFTGFTFTDSNGNVISAEDDDWNFSGDWSTSEENLFSKSINQCTKESDHNFNIIVYPNPCEDQFMIQLSKPEGSTISYRIVDEDFNVYFSEDDVQSIKSPIDLKSVTLSKNVLRFYYIISNGECDYIGHGDIQVNQ